MGYQRRVHGDSLLITGWRSIKMIKFIAIVCLAAVAYGEAEPKAEADPVLLYGGYYGHHLGYGYGYPYRYGHRLGYAGHYGYPYGHYGYYGKREAEPEAKAEAEPALLYGGYYGHHLGYAGHYGYPYTYGYYGKREAEAKPEADPALLYGGYYGHHLGYAGHYGYAGYPYAYWG